MFALRNGHWKGSPPPPLGHDPQGKVLGILGMGGIGRNLMKKASAFGMTTQYHNRTKLSDELSGGAKYVGFDELLSTSDVISLNLPLNVRIAPVNGDARLTPREETNATYYFHQRIRKDEKGCSDYKYCSRRCDG